MLGPRPDTHDRRRQLVDDAQRILDAEYASDLTLDGVARRIATSRRQLQRAYQEVRGSSFRAELARARLGAAASLLAQEASPVREIANQVGYRQPAQFAKAFRRHHGEAPAQWRTTRQPPRMESASATLAD
jgi:two-component system response regulator YesN